jgi:HK97 family phage major capsid protein
MNGLISRDTILAEVRALLSKPGYSKEDNARAETLMNLADRLGPNGGGNGSPVGDAEYRKFEASIRQCAFMKSDKATKAAFRDLGLSDAGGYLIPAGFRRQLLDAMKAFDALWSEDVVTRVDTKASYTCVLPFLDDTGEAAVATADFGTSSESDPILYGVTLPYAPQYRTGIVKASVSFLQDSAFKPLDFLARSFAIRYGRGIGPVLVSTLLAGAKVGATATGDQNSSAPSGVTQIGYQDLLALRTSVNPAYRATEKVYWLMNDNTLSAIDSLTDKNGRPIIHPQYTPEGYRLLLGYPVGLCPSMPDIGAGATPVAFGATSYFVTRATEEVPIFPLVERFMDDLEVGFQSCMSANGALLCAESTDSPVKLLQNAAA